VRVDTGVRRGDEVSVHYDPMIAKLVVWDEDRPSALRRFRGALQAFEVAGVTTNISLLSAIASHAAFAAGQVDTGFIERHRSELIPEVQAVPGDMLILATLALLRREDPVATAVAASDPYSPWNIRSGWHINTDSMRTVYLKDRDARLQVMVHFNGEGYVIEVPGGKRRKATQVRLEGNTLSAHLDEAKVTATVVFAGRDLTLIHSGATWRLEIDDALELGAQHQGGSGRLTAPMPGAVVSVLVKQGDRVEKGQPLIVLEAMKMEHTIKATAAGRVSEIFFVVGQQVTDGAQLLTIEAEKA
jgi:3-methylcrotonyl-CoA carboxylase alpha subunit